MAREGTVRMAADHQGFARLSLTRSDVWGARFGKPIGRPGPGRQGLNGEVAAEPVGIAGRSLRVDAERYW